MNRDIIEKQKYVTNNLTDKLREADGNIKSVVYSVNADCEEFICVFFRDGRKKFIEVTGICLDGLFDYLLENIKN